MSAHDLWWLLCGVILGWITKIPIFLHYYREWEREREAIRKWMGELQKGDESK